MELSDVEASAAAEAKLKKVEKSFKVDGKNPKNTEAVQAWLKNGPPEAQNG